MCQPGTRKTYTREFSRVECATLDTVKRGKTRQLSSSDIYHVPQSQALRNTRPQCSFNLDIHGLLEHGFKISERYHGSPALGYWGRDTTSGPSLRLSNSVALVMFENIKALEAIFLILSTRAETATLELATCPQWKLLYNLGLIKGILQNRSTTYPLWTASGGETTLREHKVIGLSLPSGKSKVTASFQRADTQRHFFEIELRMET